MTASRNDPLENVLERTINEIDEDEITFGDVLDLFGDRSFGPIIAFLGLLVVLPPLGAIPGLPAIIGLVIILFSAQIIFGANHIWVPGFIKKRSISKEKLKQADKKAIIFDMMIDLAEKEYNIPIRKNSSPEQSTSIEKSTKKA